MTIHRPHFIAYARRHSLANALRHFIALWNFPQSPAQSSHRNRRRAQASKSRRQQRLRLLHARTDRQLANIKHISARFFGHVVNKIGLILNTLAFALLSVSCSTQVVTKADGSRVVNNNLLSKGRLIVNADGSIDATGSAEKAAEELGSYAGAVLKTGLIRTGIQAVNPTVKTITDAVTD